MSYIAIPVPDEYVPEVYRLLASLTRGTTTPRDLGTETEASLDAPHPSLPRLVGAVTPSTRAMLLALAKRVGEELNYDELHEATDEELGAPAKLGGALRSLQIQSRRLGMPEPIQRRVVTLGSRAEGTGKRRNYYSIDAARAGEILRILGRD